MKSSRFPHSLALIFAMIIIAQLLTYVIPSGEFQYETQTTELTIAERTIALPAGRKLLLAEQRRIQLPDGRSIQLPQGCQIRFGNGPAIPLGISPESTLPGTLADGSIIHLPTGGIIELPEQVATGDGQPLAFDGNKIILPDKTTKSELSRKVIAGTYEAIPTDQAPSLPWHAFLTKIPKGLETGAEIIFFVFIVGGVIAVIRATGAIDALIAAAIRTFGHNRLLLVSGMVTLFAVGSSTIGMAEEYMPFIPILVAMCLALRLDAIVAMGIVYIGAGVGYGCAALNPFTVVIAKDIAGADLETGVGYRCILLVAMIAIGVHHILRYSRKITADPSASLVADIDYSDGYELPDDVALTSRRALVLAVFGGGIAFFIAGIAIWDWYLIELAAIFLGLAIASAFIGKIPVNTVCEKFCLGAAEMTTTALLIGFARTIQVVLTDAMVIHTIIDSIASMLNQLDSPALAADGMLIVQSICNFLIPSGSGQAYVTMPIMAPVAELTNVGKETAIFAYQFGDGFTNMIVPTNALLMGMLVLGRIPYQRWLRFILPLMIKIYAVAFIVLAIAGTANYGSAS